MAPQKTQKLSAQLRREIAWHKHHSGTVTCTASSCESVISRWSGAYLVMRAGDCNRASFENQDIERCAIVRVSRWRNRSFPPKDTCSTTSTQVRVRYPSQARVPALHPRASDSPVKTTLCNGKSYTFQELSGYGFVPSNFRDKYDDTLSLGSSIAIERSSWKKLGEGSYEGTLWLLPDRGW
ncbi:hypothetical protein C7212DRAFT_346470 [Tuber magnatum]|uniref:Uncharacterized protein n=1 Tax=Tuber magnatum TaxID=42249 RepID=A0A317SIL4_9PEZI|nr:hypothetical protein C7212DRAFT_346470 [Tuber magnatum]